MSIVRFDPGPCIICGAAHTTCVGPSAGVGDDSAFGPRIVVETAAEAAARAQAALPPLAPGEFSTKTYRRSRT